MNDHKKEAGANTVLDPFVADVFTAMFNESANTTNALLDRYQSTIADLKADYVRLYEAVERANAFVDSLRIDNILASADWKYRSAKRDEASA